LLGQLGDDLRDVAFGYWARACRTASD